MEISIDSLIKIHYNLSLMIKLKEELYGQMISEDEIGDAELELMTSDLEQLEDCKTSVEAHLHAKAKEFPEKKILNKLKYYSMVDQYAVLMKKQQAGVKSEIDLTDFLVNKKTYIH